ncbi:DUF1998 domain-containing protein [Streptomyces sp. INA 01156]
MNDKDAAEASGDSSELPVVDEDGKERRRKAKVIPYVEDRRNILVVTLDEALPEPEALSLMYALERGIEAAFELEDAELSSELLPPDGGPRDRLLFTEAAEGGAGVLRRLQAEGDALAKAARYALAICHFEEDGTDLGGPHPDRPCALGCYECLLTYGNQLDHALINRHAARHLLVRFASATARREGRGESRSEQYRRLLDRAPSASPAAGTPTAVEAATAAELAARGDFLGWAKARDSTCRTRRVRSSPRRTRCRTSCTGCRARRWPCSWTRPTRSRTPSGTRTPRTASSARAGTSSASRRARTGTPSPPPTPATSAPPPPTDHSFLRTRRHTWH